MKFNYKFTYILICFLILKVQSESHEVDLISHENQTNFEDVVSSLETGDAILTIISNENPDDINRKSTKKVCSLIVKKFLNVCGNACINGNLQVNGTFTTGGSKVITGARNVGSGEGLVFRGLSGDPIIDFRTLLAGSGISITTNPDDITITSTGGNGDVFGPASSTNNAVVLFDGTTGKLLKQSPAPVTIDGSNNLSSVNDINMTGDLNMPATNSSGTAGVINLNANRFLFAPGVQNTFLGQNAGNFTLTGTDNTGIGAFALESISIGNYNTALGTGALISLFGGSNNVAVGGGALANLSNAGSNNIAIGADAGFLLTRDESNNILIGNFGVTGQGNSIHIGQNQGTCFIAGIRGVTTGVANAIAVLIDSNGQLGTASSSKRFKENIKDMEVESEGLMKLRPVCFNYKSDETKSKQYGLIAEEVAQVLPNLVVNDKDNEPYTVKYHELPALLLNELQKMVKKQEEQESTIKKLLERIEQLESKSK